MSGVMRDKLEKAQRAYEDFRGTQPRHLDEYNVPDNNVFYELGICDGILYTTKRDGKTEHYIHEFKGRARPTLAVSADGREIRLVGGKFRVTERGIVDRR